MEIGFLARQVAFLSTGSFAVDLNELLNEQCSDSWVATQQHSFDLTLFFSDYAQARLHIILQKLWNAHR